jgi:hypothetical protein
MVQQLTKVFTQRVSPDSFNGSVGFHGLVIFTPAGSHTQVDPISCSVAGTLEAFGINKRFKKVNRVVINHLPILGKDPDDAAQKMRGQAIHMDPRKYKESAIIGNKVEVLFSILRRPADKIISALDMARGRREGKASNRCLIRKGNIFEVFSHGLRIAQVMVVVNKAIEKSLLGSAPNLIKLKWLYL